MTNCRNCGAPIEKGRCQYCGTDYRERFIVPAQGEIIMEGQNIGTLVAMDKYKMPQLHNEMILPKRPPQKRMTTEQIKRLEEYTDKMIKRFEKKGIL